MFGLFKKTSWKIDGKVLHFFRQVFGALPAEFSFLGDGLEKGLYTRFSINHAMKGNCYSIGFAPSQSDKSMTQGKDFELNNIIIKQDKQEFCLTVTVYDGLWIGFEIEKNILDFNNYQVDISSFQKSKIKSASDIKMKELVSGLTSEHFDLVSFNEFNVAGNTYYQIKDLDSGNYIAIDSRGQVFGLIHEPYKIELINKSVRQFIDDVNNKLFDFDKYVNGQNGYI